MTAKAQMVSRIAKTSTVQVVAVTIALLSQPAAADWAEVGVAYRCTGSEFSLHGFIDSNGGKVPPPLNAKALKQGNNNLSCRIRGTTIKTTVWLSGPGTYGMCGSGGRIQIMKLQVDGRNVVNLGEPMLLYCSSEPSVLSVGVTKQSKVPLLKICKGTWEWGNSFEGLECKEAPIQYPAQIQQ